MDSCADGHFSRADSLHKLVYFVRRLCATELLIRQWNMYYRMYCETCVNYDFFRVCRLDIEKEILNIVLHESEYNESARNFVKSNKKKRLK